MSGRRWLLVMSAIAIASTKTSKADLPFILGNDQFQVRVTTGEAGLFAKFGPRFDTSARVDSVKAGKEEFVAEEGLIDEFNQRWVPPPGYNDDSSAGNVFVKIGVGMLRRTRIAPYRFADAYPVEVLAATKTIFRDNARAIFEQVLPFSNGWGYRYRKSYFVDPDKRRIEITYELENLCLKEIEIDQYNHNWLALAPASKKAPWTVRTPLTPAPASILQCQVNVGGLAFNQVPEAPTFSTFAQRDRPPRSCTLVSDGHKYISIICAFPASRFSIFTQDNMLAPEIFASFRIPPNHTATWRRRYDFKMTPPLPCSSR